MFIRYNGHKHADHRYIIMSNSRKEKDFGGGGDCGYLSIAGGLLRDKTYTPQDDARLAPLLNNFEFLYPGITSRVTGYDVNATPTEKLTKLSQSVNEQTLVKAMAHALRFAVANELIKYPHRYQGAFASSGTSAVDRDTKPTDAIRRGTWIDETAIAAAAQIVGPIEVISRELEEPTYYNKEMTTTINGKSNVISLNHKGAHYTANVYNPSAAATASISVNARAKDSNGLFEMPSEEEIQRRIDQGAQEDNRRELNARVFTAGLSVRELLKLYADLKDDVSKRDGDSYLTGRTKQITLERGTTAIASVLENPELADTMLTDDFDLEISTREELIHVLSVEARRNKDSSDFIKSHIGRDAPSRGSEVDANSVASASPILAH